MPEATDARVVRVGRGLEHAPGVGPKRGPQHEALDAWIGRWINHGHVVDADGQPGPAITTSDVYEWAPGGFFVLHTAYGRVGDFDAGAIEVIGVDDATGDYLSYLFDSQGNVSTHTLVKRGNTWTYQGATTRATVEFDATNHVQQVLHERTDDGQRYVVSMEVTLTKVA